MKPEREGVIWALLTDEERAEMPTPESRQTYSYSEDIDKYTWKWIDCDEVRPVPSFAYRPRPKTSKSWQDEFEAWAKGKTIMLKDSRPLLFCYWRDEKVGFAIFSFADSGKEFSTIIFDNWRKTYFEAEEYIEPYTKETLPWPLVVDVDGDSFMVLSASNDGIFFRDTGWTYLQLAKHKTPTGEPCGIRKWRKKTEDAK